MQTAQKIHINHIDPKIALPLMEQFYSIQGEGYHQGKAAYFIRTAGCDIGCTWCDVKESWNQAEHPVVDVDLMVDQAVNSGSEIAVVTGGEPMIYDLSVLTEKLQAGGLKTHLETSGAYALSGIWDWVCFSPKRFRRPDPSIFPVADELKVVICRTNDFRWAERFADKVRTECRLFLQPEWGVEKEILPEIVEYVKLHPKWQISLQLHKYLNVS